MVLRNPLGAGLMLLGLLAQFTVNPAMCPRNAGAYTYIMAKGLLWRKSITTYLPFELI